MWQKVLNLVDAFNKKLELVQQDLPEYEKFSPDEFNQRRILKPAMFKDEKAALRKVTADAMAAFSLLQRDAACAILPRTLISGWTLNQPVMREMRGQYLQRILPQLQAIVNELLRLEVEATSSRSNKSHLSQTTTSSISQKEGGQKFQIYQAPPIDNQKLMVQRAEIEAKEIADILAGTGFVCTYEDEFYILANYPRRFKKLEGKAVQRMIDSFVKQRGINISPLLYDEVRKCLLYNSQIQVIKEPGLPSHIWPFADGLVDIRYGSRIENNMKFFFTTALSCSYIPNAKCPAFDQFLQSVTGGDMEMIDLIWKIIGYILSDDVGWKAFFVFRGPKDTGKSLLANVIASLFEQEAVTSMGITEIGKKFSMAELVNKKLTVCMDLTDEPLDPTTVGAIKTITGGDLIRAEGKYQTGRSVRIKSKLLFGTNHELQLKKSDQAFIERLIEIPFWYPVPKEKQNRNLLDALKQELPGIAVKAARAFLSLVANNYMVARPIITIPQGMSFDDEKIITEFASEKCDFCDATAKIATEDLYQGYRQFCHEKKLTVIEKSKFSEIFNRQNKKVEKKKVNIDGQILQGYRGVRLKA